MRWSGHSGTYTLSDESIATSFNSLNWALVPIPFANPLAALPARVDVTPARVMMRIRLPALSLTARSPSENTAIPVGALNVAAVPTPFTDVAEPEPANVETTREGEIMRMRLLILSATAMLPSASAAIPNGRLKLAAVPTPLANDGAPLPATVETTPSGVTKRIR